LPSRRASVRGYCAAPLPSLLRDLRIAMSDRYRMFFMQSEQNLRPFIAEIVHQAVVEAAINSILGQGR